MYRFKEVTDSVDTSSEIPCAAFDFGTTYSGYAHPFTDNPMNVCTNSFWKSGRSLKTPTGQLLIDKGEFHSFGYEAEENCADLDEKNNCRWRLFIRFEMMLHQTQVTMEAEITFCYQIKLMIRASRKQNKIKASNHFVILVQVRDLSKNIALRVMIITLNYPSIMV